MTHRFSNHANKSSLLAFVDRVAMALTTTTARAQLRTKVISVAVLAVLSLSLVACGGSSAPVAVAISTAPTSTWTNGSLTFAATVTGSSNTAVTWSVQEANGGTITAAGVYTAPTTAGTYHVVATSAADTTKTATTAVTVTAVAVSVTPPAGPFYTAQSYTFTATVTGPTNTAVNWSVQEAAGGTITAAGVYTTPAVAGTYHVVATSQADTTKTATAAVTVAAVTVSVTPPAGPFYTAQSYTFTATVTGPTNTAVNWSVQEAAGGTITAAGVYTAPTVAGTYHVVATSQADTTKTATAAVTVAAVTVSVTAPSGPFYATQSYTFTATVTGPTNKAVTWSVQGGSANGTITSGGVYTAPAPAGTYTVVATSVADTTKSGSASITTTIPGPTFTSTPPITLAQGATYTYTAVATDPAGTGITYALTAAPAGATINSSTGAVSWTPTAAELLMPSNFTVTATLGSVSTPQSWTVTPLRAVTVTYPDTFLSVAGTETGPLTSISTLGAIVPGSAATCTSGPYTFNLCATSLTSATGTYTINNVPAGFYWLANGPTERYWTNVSSFDGSTNFIGQTLGASPTAMPVSITAMTLDTTASPNVSASDAIWIGSPSTVAWFAPQSALPASGASFTDAETIPLGILPEINTGTSGDPSWVLQFTNRTPSSGVTGTVTYGGMSIVADEYLGTTYSFITPTGGTLTTSTPATLSFKTTGWGSLFPTTTTYTLSSGTTNPRLVYFGTYLASLPYTTAPMSAIGGGYPSCSSSLGSANTVPCTAFTFPAGLVGWPSHTTSQPDPDMLSIPAQANTRQAETDAGPLFLAFTALDSPTCTASQVTSCTPPDGDTVSMPVDNAFATQAVSSGWPMVLSSEIEVQVPLGNTTNSFSTNSTSQFSVTSLASAIVDQPVVSIVGAPTITWTGNTTPVSLYHYASPAPGMTLSWTAATVNSAISPLPKISGYHVIVYAAPASGPYGASLADLYTTNTSLTVPKLGLPAGNYVFVVEAKADGVASLTASPWRSAYPRGTAQIVSAPMAVTGAW